MIAVKSGGNHSLCVPSLVNLITACLESHHFLMQQENAFSFLINNDVTFIIPTTRCQKH